MVHSGLLVLLATLSHDCRINSFNTGTPYTKKEIFYYFIFLKKLQTLN